MKDFKIEIKLSRLSLFDEDLDFFFLRTEEAIHLLINHLKITTGSRPIKLKQITSTHVIYYQLIQ
jgi:hypothetical protein